MNSKMTTNSKLSTTEPRKQKEKLNKQQERNRITEIEITWRVISGEEEGRMGEKILGIRSMNGRYKIDRGKLRIV